MGVKAEALRLCRGHPESKLLLERSVRTPGGRAAYAIGVKHLCDFLGKTPSEIVEEYRADVRRDHYAGMEKWEQLFDGFAAHLEGLGLSSATVNLYHLGARMLINVNVPRSLRLMARAPARHSRTIPPPSRRDLLRVWERLDLRGRSIVGFLKDSGISAADAVGLRVGDLEGFLDGEDWCHIHLIREKEHVEYDTFIGPDAARSLRAWLGERGGASPEAPVLASARGTPLSVKALRNYFDRLSAWSGVTLSTHRLRKYFATYMALEVRHPVILKYWMGHRVARGDIEARYIIPPIPEQMELYKRAYPNISLSPLSEEAERLERELTIRASRDLGKSRKF